MLGRDADRGERYVTRRVSGLDGDQSAHAGDERFRSRADKPRTRHVQLADAALDELAMGCIDAYDQRP